MEFPNPAITGSVAQRALTPADAEAAGRMDVAAEQAVLDEQDLRDLERAEYYDGPAEPPGPTTSAVSGERGARGLILRLARSLGRRG